MLRGLKIISVFSLAALIGVLFAACGKKDHNHAPVCQSGQALYYNDSGYNCQAVIPSYGNNQFYNPAGQTNPSNVAPVEGCRVGGQTLVNWRGAWTCITDGKLRPDDGDSPGGLVPPPGVGGEFCTAVGVNLGNTFNTFQQPGQQPSQPGAVNSQLNNYVVCPPWFSCQASNTPAPAAPGTPAQPGQPAPQFSFGTGQSGTCVYTPGS